MCDDLRGDVLKLRDKGNRYRLRIGTFRVLFVLAGDVIQVDAFAVYGGHGTTASSTIVYEIEPGKRLGWHTDATWHATMALTFEWDTNKARRNLAKRGIQFRRVLHCFRGSAFVNYSRSGSLEGGRALRYHWRFAPGKVAGCRAY
jgi:hypothetical protein